MSRRFLTSAVAIHAGACLMAFMAVGAGLPLMGNLFDSVASAPSVASESDGGHEKVLVVPVVSAPVVRAMRSELKPSVSQKKEAVVLTGQPLF